MTTRSWVVRLTMPPSTNHLYKRRGTQLVRSDQYRAWIDRNGYAIAWERLSEDPNNELVWYCDIDVCEWKRTGDIDNRAKATLDLICMMTGLVDLFCDKVTIERKPRYVAPDIIVARFWLDQEGGPLWIPPSLSATASRLQPTAPSASGSSATTGRMSSAPSRS